MKQFIPVFFLLFICTFCLSNHAAAQDSAATKAKVDTEEEEWVVIPQEGEFKGGDSAFQKFVEKKLVYPKKAKRKKIEGAVTVEFILSQFGDILEVKALSGPEELRQSAVKVIKRSPKWDPSIQGGRQVKTSKKYDIIFKLDSAAVIRKWVWDNWNRGYVRQPLDGFFKGGDSAWKKYVDQNLVYPKEAKEKKIEGTVTVEFMLSENGFPLNAKALSGPEELRQSAIDVVVKSPKWWPRILSGRQVKTIKKRDIVFKLDKE